MRKICSEDMLIAEDGLINDVQFAIHNMLERKGVSRSGLAQRLGVSDAYVSQLFKDNSRNLTLKSVARIFSALGERPHISLRAGKVPDKTDIVREKRNSPDNSNVATGFAASLVHLLEVGRHYAVESNDNERGAEVAAA